MKIVLFFTLILITFNAQIAFGFDTYAQQLQSNNLAYQSNNNDMLNYLENSIYGKNYPYNSTQSRIKKLEKEILGQTTYGTNTVRLNRLYNYYTNAKRQNVYRNKYTNIKRQARKLSRTLFRGVPTGYTPPIMNNYPSRNGFNNFAINPSGYSLEREYCDAYGNCYPYYQDIDTNMGVKIIRN